MYFASAQTSTDLAIRSEVIGDVKVTIFPKGVIGGSLKTRKVIWRIGFDGTGTYYIPKTLVKAGKYVFFKSSCSICQTDSGYIVEASSGKSENINAYLNDFYFAEGNFIYFDNSDPLQSTYNPQLSFQDIRILKFDTHTKQYIIIVFRPDEYIEKIGTCIGSSENGQLVMFKFKEKNANLWKFAFSNQTCEIVFTIDESDTSYVVLSISKK
jgi:hypothetical protein